MNTSTSVESFAQSSTDSEADFIKIDINDEIIARAKAEEQHEIIVLNEETDKLRLNVGAAFHSQWQQIRDLLVSITNKSTDRELLDSDTLSTTDLVPLIEDKVSVVSILGNSKSGKSFIARYLLNGSYDDNADNGPVVISETEKKGATTVNVNCYATLSDTNEKTLILDYEGEKGANFPLLLYARRGLTHLTRSIEKVQLRRQAVTDYFPKLAYILSDAIILLGTEDLASTDYLTRCHEFALKANDGVSQMVNRPLLIIIQNKGPLIQSIESSAVTQNFFEIHGQEADALRPFFSDIKCFCLPHADQLQRTRTGILDGSGIFRRHMVRLEGLLATLRSQNSERSVTHAQWLYLLQRVLEIVQSGKSVSMHTLLSEIVTHDDNRTIEIAICSFLMLYNIDSIHSPGWFQDCHGFAIRVLAHCLAAEAHRQQELMSERIIHEWCEKALQEVSIKLDKFRPCVALYTGKGRSSKTKDNEHAVYCYQHKGAHEGGHRTCRSVYGLTPWKEFWGLSSTDVWPGDFVSSDNTENNNETLSEDLIISLSRMIKDLMANFHQDPKTIYHLFVALFRSWCHDAPTEIFSRVCFCVSNTGTFLCGSSRTQDNLLLQQKRRQQRNLKIMQHRIMVRHRYSDGFNWCECQTCYQRLFNAWNKPYTVGEDVTECAICLAGRRDFLFVPCGHRGFCAVCAEIFVRENRVCPICRNVIKDKQRVYDI